MSGFHVRPARTADLDALASLEERAWKRRGAPVLNLEDLERWYHEDSPYFLVIEKAGVLCGYYFARRIWFTPGEADRLLVGFSAHGDVRSPLQHDPLGNSAYAVCVISSARGAGSTLNQELYACLRMDRIQYLVGFSRLPLLDTTAQKYEQNGPLPGTPLDFALWYAHESMRLLGRSPWKESAPKPRLSLPPLQRADPMLAFHVGDLDAGLLRVQPDYMPDPGSRNFAALVAARLSTP